MTNRERSYSSAGRLRTGTGYHAAAGTDRIAFETDGAIELVGPETRTQVALEGPVDDIALDRYVVVRSGETITAYADTGVELWSTEIPGAGPLVSTGTGDVVATIAGESVAGLDAETGQVLFERTRPHPEFDPEFLVGGTGRLCLAAWSFLVCFDASGRVLAEVNLDGTIDAVGLVDDHAIAARADGVLVGVAVDSGETEWQTATPVRDLASCGEAWLPALGESETVAIAPGGRIESLPLGDGDRIVAARTGDVLAVVDGTEARLYRREGHSERPLDAEIRTDRLEPGDPLRVAVENPADTAREVTVTLDTAPIAVDTPPERVTLAAGESRELVYEPRELPDGEVDCRVLVDGTERATARLPVDTGMALGEAVSVAAVLDSIDGETATYRVDVTNRGDRPVDGVAVESAEQIAGLEPGESASRRVEYPLGATRQATVTVTRGGERATREKEIEPPDSAVELEITRAEGRRLDATLHPNVPVPVRGQFVVSIAGERIERDISLDDGDVFTLVVVLPEGGGTTAAFESPLLGGRRTVTLGPDKSPADATEPANQESGGEPSPTGDIRIERSVPETVERTAAFTERIRLETTETGPVTVSDQFESYTVGELPADTAITLHREHVVFDGDEITLPPIECEGATADARTLVVRDRAVGVQARIRRTNDGVTLGLAVTNDGDRDVSVLGFEAGERTWTPDVPVTVEAGKSETVERQFDGGAAPEGSVPVRLIYRVGDGEPAEFTTLAPVDDDADVDIAAALTDRSQFVADTRSVVEIAVENRGEGALRDLSLGVVGDAIVQTPISPDSKTVPRLEPGERATILADVEPERTGQTSVALTIEGSLDGHSLTDRCSFSGPVASTRDEWDDTYLAEWDDTERVVKAVGPEPGHLVTPLRPTEGGSRQ